MCIIITITAVVGGAYEMGIINSTGYFMNTWMRTDANDVITCGSHVDEHVANVWDKNENGYGYKKQMVVAKLLGSH